MNELTEYLDFNLFFYQNNTEKVSPIDYNTILIDSDVLKNVSVLNLINELDNKNKLLVYAYFI